MVVEADVEHVGLRLLYVWSVAAVEVVDDILSFWLALTGCVANHVASVLDPPQTTIGFVQVVMAGGFIFLTISHITGDGVNADNVCVTRNRFLSQGLEVVVNGLSDRIV